VALVSSAKTTTYKNDAVIRKKAGGLSQSISKFRLQKKNNPSIPLWGGDGLFRLWPGSSTTTDVKAKFLKCKAKHPECYPLTPPARIVEDIYMFGSADMGVWGFTAIFVGMAAYAYFKKYPLRAIAGALALAFWVQFWQVRDVPESRLLFLVVSPILMVLGMGALALGTRDYKNGQRR
jgi:hypothetical protein